MSQDYDAVLRGAKKRVTQLLCQKEAGGHILELGGAIDDLNKAWDELSDCLVRQVEARDTEIRVLLNRIAELNKPR